MSFTNIYLKSVLKSLEKIEINQIKQTVNFLHKTKKNNGRIFFLGVGGSAANCSHAVNDFRKLCNIECYSPIDNVSELTARINDEGFDNSFADWLKVSNLNKNDLIFIFSVGGGNQKRKVSLNLVEAIKLAKKRKSKILGILGRKDGYTAKHADVAIIIPNVDNNLITPLSESFQSIIWHLLVSHPKLKVNKTKW